MNPDKTAYKNALIAKIDTLVSHGGVMSDAELVSVFNGVLEVNQNVSPTKGGGTVKHVFEYVN